MFFFSFLGGRGKFTVVIGYGDRTSCNLSQQYNSGKDENSLLHFVIFHFLLKYIKPRILILREDGSLLWQISSSLLAAV